MGIIFVHVVQVFKNMSTSDLECVLYGMYAQHMNKLHK